MQNIKVYKLSKPDKVELQIQQLLLGKSAPEKVVENLINLYSPETQPSKEELEKIAIFLLTTGTYIELNQYLSKALIYSLDIPWGHYCESIFLSSALITETIKSALLEGAKATNSLNELSRSNKLDFYEEGLKTIREEKRKKLDKDREKEKQELFSNFETLNAQGLVEDADEIFQKLLLKFPDDPNIAALSKKGKKLVSTHQLEKFVKKNKEIYLPLEIYVPPSPESQEILNAIKSSMDEALHEQEVHFGKEDLELRHDFIIAELMLENYSDALNLCPVVASTNAKFAENTLWVRLEILFQLRKFVELLEEIKLIEPLFKPRPDATIALSYLKALCLWELDEATLAIHTMESIVFIRPHYRSASIILQEWKSS
jgi:tetratricopeptide (TPR) repeat protein